MPTVAPACFVSALCGSGTRMVENAVKGAMAGLAGTTALNAATYVDMVWRGRPASSTPEQVIEELAKRSGRTPR
jgi:hypothetical protein